jgi:hypothetical protein
MEYLSELLAGVKSCLPPSFETVTQQAARDLLKDEVRGCVIRRELRGLRSDCRSMSDQLFSHLLTGGVAWQQQKGDAS